MTSMLTKQRKKAIVRELSLNRRDSTEGQTFEPGSSVVDLGAAPGGWS